MLRGALWLVILLAACRPAVNHPLVVTYTAGPESLRPHENNEEYASSPLSNVFEALVDLGPDLELRPRLAESWHTPDDLTWHFRLREGLSLHDGRHLSASDVVACLERHRSDPASRRRAELAAVQSLAAEGERTVVVRTRYPVATLPNRLASAPIWLEARTSAGFPVGSGPYRISGFTRGVRLQLTAFASHPDGPAAIAEVEFRVIADTRTQLDLLRRGEADIVPDLSIRDLDRVRQEPGVRVLSGDGLLVLFLAFDCARERSPYVGVTPNPLRDPRVRQAVAHAIDRPRRVREQFHGEASVIDQIVGPGAFGYHHTLTARPFDVARARALLSEAGHAAGFALDLDYVGGDPDEQDGLANALAADLRQVGLRVTPRPRSDSQLLEKVENRDTSFYLMPWIGTSGDFGISAEYLLHSPGGAYGVDNGGGYADPEFDRLLETASRSLQTRERRELLWAAAERIHQQAAVVPLVQLRDHYAVRSEIRFTPRRDRQIRVATITRSGP